MDDLHRVLATLIGQGLATLRIDGEDPQVRRDVTVQQIELKVDEDRLSTLDLELEPVEPAFAFIGVGKVVDIIGRAIDVAAEVVA